MWNRLLQCLFFWRRAEIHAELEVPEKLLRKDDRPDGAAIIIKRLKSIQPGSIPEPLKSIGLECLTDDERERVLTHIMFTPRLWHLVDDGQPREFGPNLQRVESILRH